MHDDLATNSNVLTAFNACMHGNTSERDRNYDAKGAARALSMSGIGLSVRRIAISMMATTRSSKRSTFPRKQDGKSVTRSIPWTLGTSRQTSVEPQGCQRAQRSRNCWMFHSLSVSYSMRPRPRSSIYASRTGLSQRNWQKGTVIECIACKPYDERYSGPKLKNRIPPGRGSGNASAQTTSRFRKSSKALYENTQSNDPFS